MSTYSLDGATASFLLPLAPSSLTGRVKAWSEPVTIPTYKPGNPSKNPVFADRQSGPSGYPFPVLEGRAQEARPHIWQALHIENEFLRLMVLPEIGGRIHVGIDKTSELEFLYRDESIQSDASGSSINGGLEVNWPNDPRARAFRSTNAHIEEHADGSRTAWCSSFDTVTRLTGMHGVCLYPGRAYIELKMRLFNRTSFSHAFNWSAKAAFPSAGLAPSHLAEADNQDGFFAAYCPVSGSGLVQVADQYSSGGQLFAMHSGYGELRSGLYSGPAPRVSCIKPCETKSASQFWYPFTKIGSLQKANVDAAVRLSTGEHVSVGVAVTRAFPNALITLTTEGTVLSRWTRDLNPGQPFFEETTLPSGIEPASVTLRVATSSGRELISFTPKPVAEALAIAADKEESLAFVPPRKVASVETLYLTGLRAQHNQTASHTAEEYWQEALRRDSQHAGANNAFGLLQLRRGEFGEAEAHFRRALATYYAGNTDGLDGELHYNLGLALRFQERDEEAYGEFHRASWDFAWRAPALHAAAELDCKRGNFGVVPKYLYEALRLNADNNNARSLAVVLFRRFGRAAEAEHLVRESLTLDPLDPWACHLAGRPLPGDNQTRLDLAFDYARAGLYEPAVELLTGADTFAKDGSLPMIHYTLATFYMRTGDFHAAQREFVAAAATQPDYCFPHRLEEMMVLARAIALQPEDARAQYYLGNLLYHFGLPLQAMEIWQSSAKLDENFPTVWRNLAIGYYNVTGDNEKALDAFDRAVAADPADNRVRYERDQLWKKLGVPPALRYQEMPSEIEPADGRVDLALELATLHNTNGEPDKALALFSHSDFKGWEQYPGGVDQYVRTFVKLGRDALAKGENERARDLFLLPLSSPAVSNVSAGGAPESAELQFWLGEALNAAGHHAAAQTYWQKVSTLHQPSEGKAVYNENTFFVALSFGRIGERQQSRRLLRELWFAGRRIAREKTDNASGSQISGRLSSFKEESAKQGRVRGLLLQSQARVGLGQYKLAGRLLEQLLTLDPNNSRALDLISDLELATTSA